MKIKYSCKKILNYENAENGFYLVIAPRRVGGCAGVFHLKNPVIRDNYLYWDNDTNAWDIEDKDVLILNKEDGELYLKTHNLKVIN